MNKVTFEITADGWHVAVTLNDKLVAEQYYKRDDRGFSTMHALDGYVPDELIEAIYNVDTVEVCDYFRDREEEE